MATQAGWKQELAGECDAIGALLVVFSLHFDRVPEAERASLSMQLYDFHSTAIGMDICLLGSAMCGDCPRVKSFRRIVSL